MKPILVLEAHASAFLLAGSLALAQPGPPGGPYGLIGEADSDGDGAVSAAEWSALFSTLDADGDGRLEAVELPSPRLHGHTPGEPPAEALAHLLARGADSDGDSAVSASEWEAHLVAIDESADGAIQVAELPRPPFVRDTTRLVALADRWDADDDGSLQHDELAALFAAADRDGDGALSRSDRDTR